MQSNKIQACCRKCGKADVTLLLGVTPKTKNHKNRVYVMYMYYVYVSTHPVNSVYKNLDELSKL